MDSQSCSGHISIDIPIVSRCLTFGGMNKSNSRSGLQRFSLKLTLNEGMEKHSHIKWSYMTILQPSEIYSKINSSIRSFKWVVTQFYSVLNIVH